MTNFDPTGLMKGLFNGNAVNEQTKMKDQITLLENELQQKIEANGNSSSFPPPKGKIRMK